MGAWIEISQKFKLTDALMVAPLVGAWIEISEQTPKQRADTSLLSWERGLKSECLAKCRKWLSRSSRGSVD